MTASNTRILRVSTQRDNPARQPEEAIMKHHPDIRRIDPCDLAGPVAQAVLEAGAMLRAEFHRPGGPRRTAGGAAIDLDIERMLRARLSALHPSGWRGEETPRSKTTNGDVWVVDPHDGTADFLSGRRGSAVSVALVRDGRPVLGVVFAPTAPDDTGDFFIWAEGGPTLRNGAPIGRIDGGERPYDSRVALALPSQARRHAAGNHARLAPAKMIAVPSIAYRLALAAAADVDVAVSITRNIDSYDIAAGHALLASVGGILVERGGRPVDHGERSFFDGCIGGQPALVREVVRRKPSSAYAERKSAFVPASRAHAAGPLSWAQGALVGLLAGDALGAQVEFMSSEAIARTHPEGVREMCDGGYHRTLAGQPTDDGEMALALARSILSVGRFDRGAVAGAYIKWRDSGPFDIGNTTRAGLAALEGRGRAFADSQANGALMRVTPIGVFAAGRPELAAQFAREDAVLTHPNPVCLAASSAFAAAIAAGVGGSDNRTMWSIAHAHAGHGKAADLVRACLIASMTGLPASFEHNSGWVLTALHNAFHRLWIGQPLEAALIETVACGGDTDTNAAICGALLGAAQGLRAIPVRWRRAVLGCRAVKSGGVAHPRPSRYWPDEALDLAEALLTLSGETVTGQAGRMGSTT